MFDYDYELEKRYDWHMGTDSEIEESDMQEVEELYKGCLDCGEELRYAVCDAEDYVKNMEDLISRIGDAGELEIDKYRELKAEHGDNLDALEGLYSRLGSYIDRIKKIEFKY